MNNVLVTGASTFLGYHTVKRLNALGCRPRVLELPECRTDVLDRLSIDRAPGDLADPNSVRAACTGIDTLLHLAFKVNVGGGDALLAEMQKINVAGTQQLLQAAARAGVSRAVVTGSSLAVGVNRAPVPLDETANWSEHGFDLPYARMRRQAELTALSLITQRFSVSSVCPSFTFGPDDPIGAPANSLVRKLMTGKQRFTLNVGFGCLDVRDFADGMVRAAQQGRAGERYLLSGENVTANELVQRVVAITGVKGPRFNPPMPLLHAAVAVVGAVARLRRKAPPVTREVLQVIGRYAWYDSGKARRELGWTPRALDVTLTDTIAWLRRPAADESARSGAAAV
jgi:dihydroflavonol-4-reductase